MTYSKRDFEVMMRNNGYSVVRGRGRGSHTVYSNGKRSLSIPLTYNKMIIKRLIKEYNLVEA